MPSLQRFMGASYKVAVTTQKNFPAIKRAPHIEIVSNATARINAHTWLITGPPTLIVVASIVLLSGVCRRL